jgi:4-alpha-glucanotransferase
MNRPGEPYGNWGWRLEPGALTPALAERLRAATVAAGR